ncbi:hypothetical protein BDZ94DRAFT_1237672 [Collybia nuda]|uniref:DUF6534 domain-containing protein n=1 Tax=Collybia nuda TaxID=64659 RepID=A0A9P6CD53_9AGAR|nr:hypothetical protein BDZ94DRAFT_1237672 [Collybia nuda]
MYDLFAAENVGSMIIGQAIGLVLFGAVVLQGYMYYQTFSSDHFFLKLLAGVVLFLEIAHSFTTTYLIYHYVVVLRGFAPSGPNSYELSISVVPAPMVATIVQGFFAFRIYRLSGTIYICAICWILFLLRLVGSLALAVEAFIDVSRVPNMITIMTEFQWLLCLVFIIGAVADVIITASLCYYLRRLAPRQQFKTTSQVLNSLLVWAIRTGMITSITSIMMLIFIYVKPYAGLFSTPSLISFTKYVSSNLVWNAYGFYQMLNLRRELREKRVTETNAVLQNDVGGLISKAQANPSQHRIGPESLKCLP